MPDVVPLVVPEVVLLVVEPVVVLEVVEPEVVPLVVLIEPEVEEPEVEPLVVLIEPEVEPEVDPEVEPLVVPISELEVVLPLPAAGDVLEQEDMDKVVDISKATSAAPDIAKAFFFITFWKVVVGKENKSRSN
ncbi:hypothetical protein [Hymenobacter jejuensis]|uniref:Uncharacterized protein n=1 Tax=Hymenobacter jejuensis TaxID=2502781 RepID=A0A5B8A1N0_9BACT|nr:hypothetical protein [Hymenobacter jejuensis]QDA61230.1 hypothetical protein FHG12_14480 [Hymenobacter jejuensis]